ncbi:MAG TPA: alpha/beta fold hydrolase [Gemmatales bacterium]|nr:alpha/beta fold hydrolase [Gemmatales bacterium]HMP58990.1 alpha/beta fold hydrolase [Gemmatales bacterium]
MAPAPFAWLLLGLVFGQAPSEAKDAAEPRIPFEQFTVQDELGRSITAYLAPPPRASAGQRLPVILFITGSGCQSVWTRHEKGVNAGLQGLLYQLAQGRARILVVEKPGVKPLDTPKRFGGAQDGSREFLEEHTLARWATANAAALKEVLARPDIDPQRVLVVGHSEGGIVAARVAAEVPAVTHVAPLSCAGVTQLFSLVELARRRAPEGQGDAAAQAVYAEWAKIRAKPDSIDDFWMGHPYRRWSTFMSASVIAELHRSKARVYVAHGTADEADSIIGFDVMLAELLAAGRDVTAERVEGGDHGFGVKGQSGMQRVCGNVVEWFLK